MLLNLEVKCLRGFTDAYLEVYKSISEELEMSLKFSHI